MKGAMDLTERSPQELELSIAETRSSLDTKIQELERRFSPREQVRRVRARLHPEPYLGVGAAAAVVTGAVLGVVGWRKYHRTDGEAVADDCVIEEVTLDELEPGPRCC